VSFTGLLRRSFAAPSGWLIKSLSRIKEVL
jgi:hypothetical protein